MEQGLGEAGREVGKRGTAVDNDDPGVAADVAERLVVGARDDVTTVAAHETEPGGGGCVCRRRILPRVGVAGTRGGVDGVWVGEVWGYGGGG